MGSLGFDGVERQFRKMEFRGDTLRDLDEASIVGDPWYEGGSKNEGIYIFFSFGVSGKDLQTQYHCVV